MDIFETVKQSVTVRQAAEAYGIQVNRNGMACCPFHQDRHPSMKIYEQRFHCFGCQAHGDVINFTARLFDLSAREAAEKLAADFGIRFIDNSTSYNHYRKPAVQSKIREPTPEQRYQKEERRCYLVLCDYLRLLEEWKTEYAPAKPEEEWHPLFVEALEKKDIVEYQLDILLFGSPDDRKAVVAERRKDLNDLEQRIKKYSEQCKNR